MLSKKAKKDIAIIINHLQVCMYKRNSDTLTENQKKVWYLAEQDATLYLYEHYGIDLPNRSMFQVTQALDKQTV